MLGPKRAAVVVAVLLAASSTYASAAGPSLRVTPTTAGRGQVVTFSGSVGSGCVPGDSVFLISRLFPGHAFGLGAITASVRANHHFSRHFRIRQTTRKRAYYISARCGGGNLGVLARLRVR
jgi:hypothetical protein